MRAWHATMRRWEPLGAQLRAWEKPAHRRGKCSSCSDTRLLRGADLWAGAGICFNSWFTPCAQRNDMVGFVGWLVRFLLVQQFKELFKNPTSANRRWLTYSVHFFVCFALVLVRFHLSPSSSLPPPLHASRSGFQMSSWKLCKMQSVIRPPFIVPC